MWISRREYQYMEKEVEYYRALAECERARADRLSDQLLQVNGCPPASETSLASQEKAQERLDKLATKHTQELAELYADEILPYVEDGSDSELSPDTLALGAEVAQMLKQ